MRILVTGGAGFIGSNLIEGLIQEGYTDIVSLDNYFTGSTKNHIKGATYIRGNTWDAKTIFKERQETFDVIFHFGEYSRIASSFNDIDIISESILRGTPAIVELAKKWNSLLIYSATSSSLGNNGRDSILSPYAWMKSKMKEYIKNFHVWFNIPSPLRYQIVHFFNVYGPRQITSGNYATVVGIFERKHQLQEPLTVVKPGTQTRDFVHVSDVVAGLIKVMKTDIVHHNWFFNTNTNYSILDIAKTFGGEYTMVEERMGERFSSIVLDSDTKELLDWKPRYNLLEYIKTKYRATIKNNSIKNNSINEL